MALAVHTERTGRAEHPERGTRSRRSRARPALATPGPAQAQAAQPGMAASATQRDRLLQRAQVWEPFTQRMWIEAGLRPGSTVLDAGCGEGAALRALAQAVGPRGHVTALDFSAQALRVARQEWPGQTAHPVSLIEGDIDTVEPLPGAPFDLVLACRVVFHLSDALASLRRLWQWVKPGGALLVLDSDLTVARSFPQLPVLERGMRLVNDAFRRSGHDIEIGARLPALFIEAGIGAADGCEVFSLITAAQPGAAMLRGTLRSLHAVICHDALADAAALARLDAELQAVDSSASTCRWPDLVAAYKRKPPHAGPAGSVANPSTRSATLHAGANHHG